MVNRLWPDGEPEPKPESVGDRIMRQAYDVRVHAFEDLDGKFAMDFVIEGCCDEDDGALELAGMLLKMVKDRIDAKEEEDGE